MSNLEYWLWFSSLRALRAAVRRALLERFGGAKEIYFAEEAALRSVEGIREDEVQALLSRDLAPASAIAGRCAELDVQIVTMQDAIYPERLRNIPDPPSVLYVKGRLPAVDAEPVITIVGTRKDSPYGVRMARKIGYEVAAGGGIVCTGLAAGIDSCAAEGALMAGGTVIGVLGTAINEVYPKWNDRLFADVQAAGALVSEYPPDMKGSAKNFPARNRIMAGFAIAAVVVEAPLRSGALITAHLAADYGRDVFAVPGNVDADGSGGTNNLLREGASVAENGGDVLQGYEARFPGKIFRNGRRVMPEGLAFPEAARQTEREQKADKKAGEGFFKFRVKNNRRDDAPTPAPPPRPKLENQLAELSETQLKIVGVMTKPGMHVDDIVDLSRLPAANVLSELTMLQIKGFVTQESGKRFTLNVQL